MIKGNHSIIHTQVFRKGNQFRNDGSEHNLQAKASGTHLVGGWLGLRAGLIMVGKRKFEPVIQPIA
jgi:hypothetical protein